MKFHKNVYMHFTTILLMFIPTRFFINCQAYGEYDHSTSYYSYSYHYGDLDCKNKTVGAVIYGILMLIMIAEFFISLILSVYCCQGASCCASQTTGML